MKLKQQPADFIVEEIADTKPGEEGPFCLYRLDKKGWTTLDALTAIRRRWRLNPARLSYGGLKDRHAQTSQYLTIHDGPPRGLTHHQVTLTYLGRVSEPFTSQSIRGNRFTITLRKIGDKNREVIRRTIQELRSDGIPNYFDDQRFGSVSDGNQFVARMLVLGRFEDALLLALAAPYAFDRAEQKREKAILREHWRDWAVCKSRLPRGHARSLVDYLVTHPEDFKGAVERMRPELLSLYLSAYQSHLWNRILARRLQEICGPGQLTSITLRQGEVSFPRNLTPLQREQLATLTLPLPSARAKLDQDDPRRTLIESVLADEGFTLDQMKLKGLRKPFFSRGDRPAHVLLPEINVDFAADENHAGKMKAVLKFDLPRGAYATLVVKRLQQSTDLL